MSLTQFFKETFDPLGKVPVRHRDRARGFVISNFMAGFSGTLAVLAFLTVIGQPSPLGLLVCLWLVAPLVIAFLPRLGLALDTAQLISLVNLTCLITFLSGSTGGLSSFLIAWMLIVPFEAALSGNRRVIFASLGLSSGAIGLLMVLGQIGWLPVSPVPPANWLPLFAGATTAAIFYAGALAITVQRTYQKMEIEAELGEAKYRFLADNALDMIIRHRADGTMSFVSPASRTMLGYAPDMLMSMPFGAFLYRADRNGVETSLAEAIATGRDTTLEFRMTHKDGHLIWVEMRCHPVHEESKGIFEIIAVARDISHTKSEQQALKSERDEAEIANKAKSKFLANISHELRTPLNAIIGFSDMMQQKVFGPLGDSHYEDYARLINESGEHLLELINDLLDMSKIEAGKYKLKCESFLFPLIIENCLRIVHLQAKQAGVHLAVDIPPKLPKIHADPRACKQILLNLLSNALKFTPAGGTITVGCRFEAGMIVLEVKDNGVGIPPVTLERLGNPFEQGEVVRDLGPTDRSKAGTGLGLSLVRSLAHLHGGEVDIASEVGTGTVVLVFLPLIADQDGENDEPMFEEVERLERAKEPREIRKLPRSVKELAPIRSPKRAELNELEDKTSWPGLKGVA
ncbi:MAG: PAS domain S-box protein [Alphaproteobacteria bacterium]|nr:MAG: PAS domain S-box protein [Alphaproteobacteria bacterium]